MARIILKYRLQMHRFPGARLNTFAIKSYAQLIIIKARDFLIDQNNLTNMLVGIKAIIRLDIRVMPSILVKASYNLCT